MKSFTEFVAEDKDPGEYDQEGQMAMTQLNNIIDAAEDLLDMLEDDENLPEWVQSKITKAEDYLDSVRDYLMNLDDDEEEEDDEEDMAEAAGSSSFKKGQKVLIVKQGVIATVTKVEKKWGYITVKTNDGRMAQIDERQFNQIKAYHGPMLSPSVTSEMSKLLKNGTSPEEVADIMRLPVEVVAEFMPNQQGVAEGTGSLKPGWMLKKDPKLAAAVKAKIDLAKKRKASHGNPAAGKSDDK